MMTFADELRDEGRVDGRIESLETVAINGLTQRLTLEMISKLTGLSIERIQQIKQEQGL